MAKKKLKRIITYYLLQKKNKGIITCVKIIRYKLLRIKSIYHSILYNVLGKRKSLG